MKSLKRPHQQYGLSLSKSAKVLAPLLCCAHPRTIFCCFTGQTTSAEGAEQHDLIGLSDALSTPTTVGALTREAAALVVSKEARTPS